MSSGTLAVRLADVCRAKDKPGLLRLAAELGFVEVEKTAANLLLIAARPSLTALLPEIADDALRAADPDQALNGLERLLGTVSENELAAVLQTPEERRFLITVLGASLFLTGILCRRPAFFHELFAAGEFGRSKEEGVMLDELHQRIPNGATFAELQKGVRHYKCREILRIGSRDLCRLADLVEVTAELSALAAATLQRAFEISQTLLRAEYGTPRLHTADGSLGDEPEFTILGMGKFGGRELNFSSDIDLIYFYSSEKGETEGLADPVRGRKNILHLHQYFCKLGELITKAIGQVTEDGFVFRVDLRLRPEGNSGDMANSLRSGEVYYESWGQSWERAAMIKARPVAGSIPLGEKLLKNLEPFVYRKFLDYAMVEDIKVMKQKIDRSLTRDREGELNLKLGRGGIREIEFFIQALQLIYAGKNPRLRVKNSLKALDALLSEGHIKAEDHRTLREAYIFLRTIEHRIQVVQERQTHNLPTHPEELRALARRSGFAETPLFQQALQNHRDKVEAIYRDLFYTADEEIREEVRPEISFLFDPAANSDLVKDILEEKGFKDPDGAFESLLVLRDGPPHSRLTEKARRHLERIAPLLLQEVIDSPEPDMALRNLERFLGILRARATFYALLAENREIIKLLVTLFGTSQFLSRIFIQHPEILDSLVARSYAVVFKERETLERELRAFLGEAADYEEKLDVLRRFRNEEFLRIALNDIHGHTPQGAGTTQLSCLADVCLQFAVEIAREELLPRFGLPFCRDDEGSEHEAAFAIVGMGKLGGMELNYHSDLDIIFIYEGDGETRPAKGTDSGRFRGQSNQEYFSRLAQRIISVLTLVTREGTVYQIDTRLRPSGNQGPLVTNLSAYEHYHESSAQAWERQALTKARVVTGPTPLARRIETLTQKIVFERPVPANLRQEIFRLRARMETEIAREGSDHLNIKTGRGGMVDVEFLAQFLQLLYGGDRPTLRQTNTLHTLLALEEEGLLSPADHTTLVVGYKFLRRLENRLRLVHDQSINDLSAERGYLVKLAKRLGYPDRPRRPDEVLMEDYLRVTEKIRDVFDRILGPEGVGTPSSEGKQADP